MKITSILVLLAGVFVSGCGRDNSQPSQPSQPATNASSNPLLAPVDYIGAVAKAQKSAGTTLSAVGLSQAIKMFEAQQGRVPKDLNELVPDILAKIPAPPAGMKYVYNPADGSLKVVPK